MIREHAKRLKLSWVREHFQDVDAETKEEYLLKLFEKEIEQRERRGINLLLKQASFPPYSDVAFDWSAIQLPPDVQRTYVTAGDFIPQKENLIFYGGVGVGKTYLATLIGLEAIQKHKRKVTFYSVVGLVNLLLECHQKGALSKLFKQIENLDLLILDELGYIPLQKEGAEWLFQVISLCYETRSIIVTTNLQFGQWNHVFGDHILTEAVIDRLIHHSHLLIFDGESHRYKQSLQNRQG